MKSGTVELRRDEETTYLYFLKDGRKRRIIAPNAARDVKERFNLLDPRLLTSEALAKYEPGAVVPRPWAEDAWIEPPDSKQAMREIIVSRLSGTGIEFGAGSRPMPLPVDVTVEYAEPFQSESQYARMNYSNNTVVPKYSCPIENQDQIKDGSLDFIVAAHVIEHTPNPVGAIVECWKKLKSGGQLVLVVPDKRRTFDKTREITPLEHLVADFETPDRERDYMNYLDFFTNAKRSDNPARDAREAHQNGIDIHYHVFTPGSFMRMVHHIKKEYAPYASIEVKPGVSDPKCLEFYLVATK